MPLVRMHTRARMCLHVFVLLVQAKVRAALQAWGRVVATLAQARHFANARAEVLQQVPQGGERGGEPLGGRGCPGSSRQRSRWKPQRQLCLHECGRASAPDTYTNTMQAATHTHVHTHTLAHNLMLGVHSCHLRFVDVTMPTIAFGLAAGNGLVMALFSCSVHQCSVTHVLINRCIALCDTRALSHRCIALCDARAHQQVHSSL